jgi:hypothetical protein
MMEEETGMADQDVQGNPFEAMFKAAKDDGGRTPVKELAQRFDVTPMYFVTQVGRYARSQGQSIPMMDWKTEFIAPDDRQPEQCFRRGYCHGYQQAVEDFEALLAQAYPYREAKVTRIVGTLGTFLYERLTQFWRYHKTQEFPVPVPHLLDEANRPLRKQETTWWKR